MSTRLAVLVTVAFTAMLGPLVPAASAEELYVAFWNVENLFDLVDDPRVEGDEEFTPGAPKRWTQERMDIKLGNLVRVISSMKDGKGPDVLGLAEVENRSVIEALIAKLKPLGREWAIVHRDSPSGRGIDCAIIYDKSVLQLKSSAFHRVDAVRTRDIVEGVFETGGERLHLFVNHWPSRRSPDSARIAAATVLRTRIDAILAREAQADIVVVGDLNDHPNDRSVRQYLKTAPSAAQLNDGTLLNTMVAIDRDPGQGTHVYDNRWQVLDHVIVSPGLLDPRGFRWKQGSTVAIKHDYQIFRFRDRSRIPKPSRSYTRNNFHANGFSDHLPVACVLTY